MKENKILDLSGERKKREKEIEEAREKMKIQQNLKFRIKDLKVKSEFSDIYRPIEKKIEDKKEIKKSFQWSRWKMGFINSLFCKKRPKEKKIECEKEIFEKNKLIKEESKKQGIKSMLRFCNFFISTPIYFLVFFIPLFFLPFTFEIFEFNKQYLLLSLTTIALIAWLIKMVIIKKEFEFLRNPLNIPILILMIIFTLATFLGVDQYSSIWGAYGWFSGNLLEMLSLGILFFIIINNIKKTELTINRLLNVFLISGFFVVLISCLSIFGFLSKWIVKISWLNNFLSEINLSNFNPIGSWETLSIYLILIIVLILGKKIKNPTLVIASYLLLITCYLLLVIINFTLAWVILLIVMGLLSILKIVKKVKSENQLKIYLIIITFVISLVSLISPLNKFIKTNLNKEIKLDNKISWQITKDVIKNHSVLGTGPGTFVYNFSKYRPAEFNQNENWSIRFGKSGNYISELITSAGFLGILVYLILIGTLFVLIFRLPFIICYFPVFSLFLVQFFYSGNTVLNFCFWFFLSISIANWKKINPEIFKTQRFGYKILKNVPEFSVILNSVLILIFFSLAGVSYFAIQNYKAEVFIKQNLKQQQAKNSLDKKIEIFKQALNLNPKQIYYQINLIQAYLDKALAESQNLKDQQSFEKVKETVNLGINEIKKAQKMASFDVKIAEMQGQFYRDIKIITSGTIPLSIEGFLKAIELEPNNPILRVELGKIYMDLAEENKEKKSEKKSKDSILEEKSFIEKIKEMDSSELIKLGQKEFQKALELKEDFWLAKLYLALSYEKQGDVKKAISDLEKIVIDLNKEKKVDPMVLFELGRLYFNQDKGDEAIKIFEMAVQLMPNYSNALYGLAIAYEKKELYNKTLEIFQKLQQLNPENEGIKRKILELKERTLKH
ncbi:MAG: tetratricopeptide repeat protein [Candidatus Kuenenbacteria bacterium]